MPPYGRGGAGNIRALAAQQEPKQKTPSDLEANRSQSLDEALEAQVLADCVRAQNEQPSQQQYAHTGRGGMGNYVESSELTRVASLVNVGQDSSGNEGAISGTYGRGGAGNREYLDGVREGDEKRRLEVERIERERMRADVEKGVGANLTMPAKVKVATRRVGVAGRESP